MIREEWIPWKIEENSDDCCQYYNQNKIIADSSGLALHLIKPAHALTLKILYSHGVHSYAVTNRILQSECMKIKLAYYGNNFFCENSFFKIYNSSYCAWIEKESAGLLGNKQELQHTVIITQTTVIEIVANYEPLCLLTLIEQVLQ